MADKIVLNKALGTYDVAQINNNFDKISDALNEKVLYRETVAGKANTMKANLDMNGFHIINLPAPTSDLEAARLKDVRNAIEGLSAQTANLINFEPTAVIHSENVQGAIEEVGTFTQQATGAVQKTTVKKLYDYVSVKDFGAVGDGATDDTVAIQNAINHGGNAVTIFFPVGAYKVSASLVLRNGVKLKGDGDPTGINGSAIIVDSTNYTNAAFRMFVKPSGLFQSAIFEDMRFLGGGNHFYFDLSTGSAYKLKWYGCVFQDAVGSHIFGANSTGGSGILVCKHKDCSVINSGGFGSSGPINGTEISGGSWEALKGPALYVGDTGNYPNLKFSFTKNRIEALYSGISAGANPVIQLDGKTYGADISDNYHENTFTTLLKVSNSRGIVYARNTHTNDGVVPGVVDVTDSQISLVDNYSLVGVSVTFSGTNNSVPRFSGNQAFGIASLYGKTTNSDDVSFMGSGGVSLAGVPGVYKAEINKVKVFSVPVATGQYFDLFNLASGSQAVLGSRASVTIKATVLIDAIDSTVGANLVSSQEVLLTAWANAGGTMNGNVTVLGSNGSAVATIRVKAGSTTTNLKFEMALTNASLAYNTNSKVVVLYNYVANENNSSGLILS